MIRRTDSNLPTLCLTAGVALLLAATPAMAGRGGGPGGGGGMRQQPLGSPGGFGGPGRDRGPGQMPGPGAPRRDPAPSSIIGPAGSRLPGPQPGNPAAVTHRGTRYLVSGGQWYERRGEDLVAVTAPAGVMVKDLPDGYSMRWIGGVPYFYADGLYYVWRERTRRYEILASAPAENPDRARDPANP